MGKTEGPSSQWQLYTSRLTRQAVPHLLVLRYAFLATFECPLVGLAVPLPCDVASCSRLRNLAGTSGRKRQEKGLGKRPNLSR